MKEANGIGRGGVGRGGGEAGCLIGAVGPIRHVLLPRDAPLFQESFLY